jgi:hypothetical protein
MWRSSKLYLGAVKLAKVESQAIYRALAGMQDALTAEIRAGYSDPSRSFPLKNGQLQHNSDQGHLYTFAAELAIPIPPESPITLVSEVGESVRGYVIDIRDFDVTLLLREEIDHHVARATLTSQPTFILETLKGRLKGLEDDWDGNERPADFLLGESQRGPLINANEAQRCEPTTIEHMGELNEAQLQAVQRCCAGSHFVWGPPGTGKTRCLAGVARALVDRGQRVLILAHANAAVDAAMISTAGAFANTDALANGKVLRMGASQNEELLRHPEVLIEHVIERTEPALIYRKKELESRRSELSRSLRAASGGRRAELSIEIQSVREELSEIVSRIRDIETRFIRSANVIGTTLSRFAITNTLWEEEVDTVLVDETSMAPFPAVFAAATRARSGVCLFGDFRQLPPIVLSDASVATTWMGRDAFEISGVRSQLDAGACTQATMLDTQYRMAPHIMNIVGDLAYGGRLRAADGLETATQKISMIGPGPGQEAVLVSTSDLSPACFLEPKPGSYSRLNPLHALLCADLVDEALAGGCRSIEVITPYRAQARLTAAATLKQRLAGVVQVATVHRFQGAERDCIIVDLVDSYDQAGPSNLTGTDEETALRLLNVAVSRARGKLVLLADANFVYRHYPAGAKARELLGLIQAIGPDCVLKATSCIKNGVNNDRGWLPDFDEASRLIVKKIRGGDQLSVLNIPEGFLPGPSLTDAIKGMPDEGSSVIVLAPHPISQCFEVTQVDLRLRNRPGGFFAAFRGDELLVGGHDAKAPVCIVQDAGTVESLRLSLLGRLLSNHRPDANVEAKLAEVCGSCTDCGEEMRPRRTRKTWVMRCPNYRHNFVEITAERLTEIALAIQIRCELCGSPTLGNQTNEGLYISCSQSAGACQGQLPSLEDIFVES